MGTTILRPSGYKGANGTITQGTAVVRTGGSSDWSALGDNSDATYITGFSTGSYPAKSTVFTLAVSGADVPAGHTVIKYRTVLRGYSAVKHTQKTVAAGVSDTSASAIALSTDGSGTIKETTSSWAKFISGVQATKANVIAAGLGLGYSANSDFFNVYDTRVELFYNDTPSAPLALSLKDGTTISTDVPPLSVYILPIATNQLQKVTHQFASDAGFTTNVITYVEDDVALRASGWYSTYLPVANKLVPGVWFYRAKATDQYALDGLWSSSISITVAHPSSAVLLNPAGDANPWNSGSVAFTWRFSDSALPLDHQTAYQIQITTADRLTVLVDTGKQSSTVNNVNLTVPTAYKAVELSWRMQTWDEGDQSAGWTDYTNFIANEVPTVTITSVDPDSPAPLVNWTFTSPSATTQRAYAVQFNNATTGALLYTSGWIQDTVNFSYTPPAAVVTNGVSTKVTVSVQDSSGFIVSNNTTYTPVWATSASIAFSVDASLFGVEDYGYNTISWTNLLQDIHFYSYQVWRRIVGTTAWTVAYETLDPTQANYTYQDFRCPANATVEYAVVQTTKQTSAETTAIPSVPVPTQVVTSQEGYWIIDDDDPTQNVKIGVTADSYSDEVETSVLQIIGRGRKQDTGTEWGITGTLTAQVYGTPLNTPAQIRDLLLSYQMSTDDLYLRNPFGQVIRVTIGQVSLDRISGGGTNDFFSASIPYIEVS